MNKFTHVCQYAGYLFDEKRMVPKAAAILEGMLSDAEVAVDAANLLEAVYIRRNAWKDLVGIDSLRLKFSEDPTLRLAWTQRIAQIYEEQIEDLDEAFNWYGRVFQERPTDPVTQEQLVRLAPKQNRWRDLGRLLDEYLDNELANSDEVLALVRIAIRVYDLAHPLPMSLVVAASGDPPVSDGPVAGRVTPVAEEPGQLFFVAEAEQPAVLIVRHAGAPGWRARVNGSPAPLLLADRKYLAARLEPGRSEVRFSYVPPGLRRGLAISALAGLVTVALLAGGRRP